MAQEQPHELIKIPEQYTDEGFDGVRELLQKAEPGTIDGTDMIQTYANGRWQSMHFLQEIMPSLLGQAVEPEAISTLSDYQLPYRGRKLATLRDNANRLITKMPAGEFIFAIANEQNMTNFYAQDTRKERLRIAGDALASADERGLIGSIDLSRQYGYTFEVHSRSKQAQDLAGFMVRNLVFFERSGVDGGDAVEKLITKGQRRRMGVLANFHHLAKAEVEVDGEALLLETLQTDRGGVDEILKAVTLTPEAIDALDLSDELRGVLSGPVYRYKE
jgi:hypothetical protein